MDALAAIGMAETATPTTVILARLLVAAILGAIVGFERQASDRPAGLRTHVLIALAAALYTILVLELFRLPDVLASGRADPGRAIEAVTAGIAFLGAGAIFRSGGTPHGLTTGAGMWLAGAVGIAAALGYYVIGFCVAIFAVIVFSVLRRADAWLDTRFGGGRSSGEK